MERRYDAVSGGANARAVMFAVRRHLQFGWDDWKRLPWWQQKVYLGELARHGLLKLDEEANSDLSLDDLAARGFSVRRV